MRARVVVWIIVGIVVAVGVIFIVSTSGKRPPARVTTELLQGQADRVLDELAGVEAQANDVRQKVPEGVDVAGLFARFDSLAAVAHTSLDAVEAEGDIKQAEASLTKGRKAASEALQTLKKIERTLNPRKR
jgi:hypothetical protein